MKAAKEIRDKDGFAIVVRTARMENTIKESNMSDLERQAMIEVAKKLSREQKEFEEERLQAEERARRNSSFGSRIIDEHPDNSPAYGIQIDERGPVLTTGNDPKPFNLADLLGIKGVRFGIEPGKGFYLDVKRD